MHVATQASSPFSLPAAGGVRVAVALTLMAQLACARDAHHDVKPAAPALQAPPPAASPSDSADRAPGAIAAPVAAPAAADKADAGPSNGARALPRGVDAKDLDPAELAILVEILDEQFDPCGKSRSFRASVEAGDCALATRLVRFVVHKLQQGYGKRKIVGLLLREIERLNTVVQVNVVNAPRMGPADAKVVVAVFSDFECPFCRRMAGPVAKLQEHYKVAVYYLHYPLTRAHPHAEGAARAAWAAHQQGKFWAMHDMLFAKAPDLEWSKVQSYASKIGLEMKRFKADVESEAARKAVEADAEHGRKIGVDGTPTFFVNGRRAETVEQLQEGIREALQLTGATSLPDTIDVGAVDAEAGEAEPGAEPAPTPAATE